MNPRTWSNLVVKRLRAVRIPPFGPRLYLMSAPIHKTSILFHDLLVIYCVSNVDISTVRHMCDGRIEVQNVRWGLLCMQIRVQTLQERRFALGRQ
jgi:hypothetical protein